jgi:hypothetical protein
MPNFLGRDETTSTANWLTFEGPHGVWVALAENYRALVPWPLSGLHIMRPWMRCREPESGAGNQVQAKQTGRRGFQCEKKKKNRSDHVKLKPTTWLLKF